MKRRLISLLLPVGLVLSLIPALVSNTEVEANALSIYSLTCSAYISNATVRSYIDTMMKYYITSNSTLQSNLNSGLPVVFVFEGGSDNNWTGSDYVNDVWNVRIDGLYGPNSVPDGQLLGYSGINAHTRSTTSGSYWSEGAS
jgi:hypothetical protein